MEDKNKISECECEANLFYKKYKSQIEAVFLDTFGVDDSGRQLTTRLASTSRFEEGEGGSTDPNILRQLAREQIDFRKAERLGLAGRGGSAGKYGGGAGKDGGGAGRGGRDGRWGKWGKRGYYYPFGFDFGSKFGSEDQYEDSLGYYQKLFDFHLQDLYEESESTSGYLKGPRKGVKQSELEYEESLDFTYKEKDEGPWMSESQRKAENYLRMHKIYELFHFLGSHLCASIPENPVDFLITLLEKCLKYRCGFMEPPLLFTFKHVESIFNSMDPMSHGVIDIEQYHTAMMTLGIGYYEKFPPLDAKGFVTKKVFIHEALKQLQIHLDELIQNFSPLPEVCYTIGSTLSILEGEEEEDEDDGGAEDTFEY